MFVLGSFETNYRIVDLPMCAVFGVIAKKMNNMLVVCELC